MPNGHILAIAWEANTTEEVLAAGRKPTHNTKAGLWPDKIVEIEPVDKMRGQCSVGMAYLGSPGTGFQTQKKLTMANLPTILNYWILM